MPVQFLPFGPWTPDRSEFNTDGTEQALNVIRTTNGYRPFASLEHFSSTDNLPSGQPVGMFWGRSDASGLAVQWVVVNGMGVYELVGAGDNTQVWTLVQASPGGSAVTSFNRWRPAIMQNDIYVTNYDNKLCRKLIASGTGAPNFDPIQFKDAAGDDIVGATNQVKFRYVAVIRDFLVGGYCEDPTFTDPGGRTGGFHPDRMRWSAIGDANFFSLEGDADRLSDFQDLADAGEIRGVVGGEYGIILCENGLFRMDFVGPPNIFSFNRIERARGVLEPNSVVAANNIVYYLAADGWRSFDGQRINPIGAEKFDRWFFNAADRTTLNTMSRAVDPNNQLIVWAFNTDDNTEDVNDCMLIYNYTLNEATYARQNCSLVGTFISPGFTLEGLDFVSPSIDTLPASLDSASFVSQEQSFGGIRYDQPANPTEGQLHTFTGANLEAVLDTGEQRLGGDTRIRVQRVQAAVESNAATTRIQIAGRNRQGVPTVFGPPRSITPDGEYVFNGDARYQRGRALITGDWSDATGLFFWFEKTSDR